MAGRSEMEEIKIVHMQRPSIAHRRVGQLGAAGDSNRQHYLFPRQTGWRFDSPNFCYDAANAPARGASGRTMTKPLTIRSTAWIMAAADQCCINGEQCRS